ncbi:hypothetical protein CLOSTMETH_00954 [[Clostridium] methylpentosum DSM 5476]|uniref:Uncharacterized protein n=1 Tax=[Clostridium] methylpentosum DSM 5476 TaxID=537013 RepID=C0EAU0_9FIRM|nr:hypothetical protein CLOSTMETH_00954 [[Clostridium] methylpentosum DSM 5476]
MFSFNPDAGITGTSIIKVGSFYFAQQAVGIIRNGGSCSQHPIN